MMDFGNLSHEELEGILQKTLKYLGPEELEEVVCIKPEREVIDHTKKKLSDALSITDETFDDIFNKSLDFLKILLTFTNSSRSVYVENLHDMWKHFSSVEKALFAVLVVENLIKVMAGFVMHREEKCQK